MKKIILAAITITTIASCNSKKAGWTDEEKKKEFDACKTSLMFKKENDALPEDKKKAVCDCMVQKKEAAYPKAETATMDLIAKEGVDAVHKFRDSCIAELTK